MAIFSNQILAQTMPPLEAGVSHELAIWRAANYSDVRYKLNLTLEKMSPVLKGTIEISVKNNADLIVLDWRKIRGKEDSSKISNLFVNGRSAYFEELNEHLVLKEGVVKGAVNTIKLDFTSPIATSGASITRYVDKEDGAEYLYSLFVPSDASTAFPCFDQPDLKARFKLGILAPEDWKATSNENSFNLGHTEYIRDEQTGEKFEIPHKKGMSYITFFETKPISTYVFAFAAGDFAKFEDDFGGAGFVKTAPVGSTIIYEPLHHPNRSKIFVRKSQAEKFKSHEKEVFRLNREGVKFLESWFDYKFPFPKYDLVMIPEFPFGGMEHAGATFLREDRVIFPSEPTANDYITRANVIFHEAAHQWFGDTVTMKWFDDLWLKEGFAEFMAYKTMEKVMPQYNAWKAFYERNKPLAYLTDSTKGTTPIYQEIPNLSAAKSAYGNIVYRKAPSFLRQAEFYLGEDKFQTAVRAFLKQNAFKNAEWQDLVKSFSEVKGQNLNGWAEAWVIQRGLPIVRIYRVGDSSDITYGYKISQSNLLNEKESWDAVFNVLQNFENGQQDIEKISLSQNIVNKSVGNPTVTRILTRDNNYYRLERSHENRKTLFIFPNYQDYGYGIFLLDQESRAYILANIQTEKDDFLRAMMWGALWDSVREAELNPKDYVELAIKNVSGEKDELTVQTILGRVSTAMNYYLPDNQQVKLAARLEKVLLERTKTAETLGLRITFYRALLNVASTEESKQTLKEILTGKAEIKGLKLKTKDKFDLVTKLLILGDADAPKLLEDLSKTETSDEAKRYLYAARAGIATAENKAKFWNDFVNDKELSESYIESAFVPFNSVRHADLTLPFLEKALAELPNLKRNRKIFFVNGWLSAFIGGQRDEQAFAIVNKFLADNPNLDKDLRLKILEVADNLERSIKIRRQFKS